MEISRKYKELIESIIAGNDGEGISFTEREVFDFQKILLNFYNLVSFEDNIVLNNQQITQDLFLHDKFFIKDYVEGTPEYKNLMDSDRRLRNLKVGEILEIEDLSHSKSTIVKYKNVYEKIQDNVIKKYSCVLPMEDLNKRVIKDSELELIKEKNPEKIFEKNGKLCYGDDNDYITFTKDTEGNNIMLPYDDDCNPFRDKNFKLYNSDGEIKNLRNIDSTKLIKKIRHAEAHHKMLDYCNGEFFGAKAFILNDKTVALVSNKWYEKLCKLATCSYKGVDNKFKFVYLPKSKHSAKSEQAVIDKIDSIKILEVETKDNYDKNYFSIIARNIIDNYRNCENIKIDLEEFFLNHISKRFSNVTVSLVNPYTTEVLKRRFAGDKGFYNIFNKEKDNNAIQDELLIKFIEEVYNFKIIEKSCLNTAGKVRSSKFDMKQMYTCLMSDLSYVQYCSGRIDSVSKISYANNERYISMCALLAYKNLVDNNFVEFINQGQLSKVKGYVDCSERGVLKNKLMATNMDMFFMSNKTNNKTDISHPKTLIEKMAVLRAIRNSIAHNSLFVQIAKSGDVKDYNFVFYLMNKCDCSISVNCKKFVDFIIQPLFANYAGNTTGHIIAKNKFELEKTLVDICSSKEKHYNNDRLFLK